MQTSLRNIILIGVITLLKPGSGSGQVLAPLVIDSLRIEKLKDEAELLKSTQKIDKLNEIGREYYYLNDIVMRDPEDSVKRYINLALIESRALKYEYGEAVATILYCLNNRKDSLLPSKLARISFLGNKLRDNNLLGELNYLQYELCNSRDSARFDYAKKSYEYFTQAKNPRGIAQAGLGYGSCLVAKREFETAIAVYQKGYSAALNWGASYKSMGYFILEYLLQDISRIYALSGDYVAAIEWLRKAISAGESTNLGWRMYTYIAELFKKTGQYDSAYYYFALYDKADPGNGYNQMLAAETDLFTGKQKKALRTLRHLKRDGTSRSPMIDLVLARAHLANNEFESALPYLSIWHQFVVNVNPLDELMLDIWKGYADIYYGLGKYDSACYYQQKYFALDEVYANQQFIWRLNNKLFTQEKAAEDQARSAQFALLEKDRQINNALVKTKNLEREKQETELQLAIQNNRIKLQELERAKLLKEEKQARIILLDRENKLLDKSYQLKEKVVQQESARQKILLGGLAAIIFLGLFFGRSLVLKRKYERLRTEGIRRQIRVQQLETEKTNAILKQKATSLEMQALRAQMNPHFIFNSLNAINSFIQKNEAEAASDYLTRFSRLIRMVLVNSQYSLITLEEELTMLKLYLEMEKLRFENSFSYVIEIDEKFQDERVFIPPLILQPYCENAIAKNLDERNSHVRLTIHFATEEDLLVCTISDNGVIRPGNQYQHREMGLQIAHDRIQLMNKEKTSINGFHAVSVENGINSLDGTRVKLKIKFRESKEYVHT